MQSAQSLGAPMAVLVVAPSMMPVICFAGLSIR